MTEWRPDLSVSTAPRYIALADCIEADLAAGRLQPGERLPAQRSLARALALDFTTVARGYAEARRRGLLSSQVGSGTFVTGPKTSPTRAPASKATRSSPPDHSMNLPPEDFPADLVARMQDGLAAIAADVVPLMRYQTFDTSEQDTQAALTWLNRVRLAPDPETLVFAPGAQAALAGILTVLTQPGDQVACEAVTYPGIRSLCAQMGLRLTGLPMDAAGIVPEAFDAICDEAPPSALYLNPVLHNPTTRTIPDQRRKDLIEIASRYGVPILEDDAYGQLARSAPPSFATLAPELTWYVGSLSKSVGAGLRLAHVIAPDKSAAWQVSRSLRTAQVMPSPLTLALATRWISDGTCDAVCGHVRQESAARQRLAATCLKQRRFLADPDGFHLWLMLENGWTRSAFAGQMRMQDIGVVEADAFTVTGQPEEAVRLCLGGPISRSDLRTTLELISATLAASPEQASAFF